MSQKSHTFEDALDLELGGSLSTPHVNYTTYGELNASRDNVIWACHALTANSEVGDWWNALFGEGELFDPTKYFIICANNLGSPYGTSSPKTINPTTGEGYRHEFPAYTIRDTAALHLRLLDHLNIASIHCLIGGSCGGNIAQEMAISLGDRVKSMRIMCCSAQESPWVISIHESQRIAMHADLTFKGNEPTAGQEGLRGARAFALPFYRSHASFAIRQSEDDLEKVSDFKAASYVRYQGQKFVDRYDPFCYYHQLNALDTHNVGRGRGSIEQALYMIKADTQVIGFSSDLLIPTSEQHRLASLIPGASYVEIETQFGHDAFLIETDALREVLVM